MNKNRFFSLRVFMGLWMLISLVSISSCSKDNDNLPSNPDSGTATDSTTVADYTIILYATGGTTLDDELVANLNQVKQHGYSSKVRFTGLVKFSAEFQAEEGKQGTRLINLVSDSTVVLENTQYADATFRMDNPDNLTAFIKNAKERMPANKYVLVLWDHGSGFNRTDDQPISVPSTRGLLSDDNCKVNDSDAIMSMYQLEEGLKNAGTKFELLYWDMCLMNMMETDTQIRDYATYILGSAHLVPSSGGCYTDLINTLEKHADIPSFAAEYIPIVIQTWKGSNATPERAESTTEDTKEEDASQTKGCDLALVDVSKIDGVLTAWKNYAGRLVEIRSGLKDAEKLANFNKIQSESLYRFDTDQAFYDMDNYAARVANSYGDEALKTLSSNLTAALNEMLLVRDSFDAVTNPATGKTSIGIVWLKSWEYNADAYTLDGVTNYGYTTIYPMLAFDKATSWSKFLTINYIDEDDDTDTEE